MVQRIKREEFLQIEDLINKCFNSHFEPQTKDDLARSLEGFSTEDAKLLIELSTKRILLKEHLNGLEFVSFVTSLVGLGFGESSLNLVILEDFLDTLNYKNLCALIEHISSIKYNETGFLSSSKGRGLALLRLCNELLRRLSKSCNPHLCGHILLFLSSVFCPNERSGLNLKGDVNAEPLKSIRDAENEDISLFNTFIRFVYSDLSQCPKAVLEYLARVFSNSSNGFSKAGCRANSAINFFYDARVNEYQCHDDRFMESVLIMTKIIVSSIKDSKASSLSQKEFANELENMVKKYLKLILRNPIHNLALNHIFLQETNWTSWKQQSCPNFVKSQCVIIPMTNRSEAREEYSVIKENMSPRIALNQIKRKSFSEQLPLDMDSESSRWKRIRFELTLGSA